jgi:glycosyltransferase involved in cell wall biosynthesis
MGRMGKMISIIVPHFKEPYLEKTLQGLKDNAEGEIEILAIEGSKGMRAAINEGLSKARGEWIIKVDAHCMFGKGYDRILTKDCKENWLMVPRRCPLRPENWTLADNSFIDYHYLTSPTLPSGWGWGTYPIAWKDRTEEKVDTIIDDIMTMQGSFYFANRKYFMEHVGFLDDSPDTYGSFCSEPLEVGMKYWLNGGEMKVDKNTWYAHLFKSRRYYGLHPGLLSAKKKLHDRKRHEWGAKHWLNNEEPGMLHKFEWLVEKFWPVPGWPEDRSEWRFHG